MGSAPMGGMKNSEPGSHARAPDVPLEAAPLPEPEPGTGGRALGAGRPVPPPQGRGPSFPPAGAAGAAGVLPPAGTGLAGTGFSAGGALAGMPAA